MNRRELFVALAATAVAGEGLAAAEPANVMGSHVFDWNSLTDMPNEHGSTRTVCSTPTATLENLEIHVSTLKPGMSPHPPHKHPNEELIIIRQGTVETLSNGAWIRVGPGSVDLQRIEPTAWIQERGHGGCDLSRSEREDGEDAGGRHGVRLDARCPRTRRGRGRRISRFLATAELSSAISFGIVPPAPPRCARGCQRRCPRR